MLPLFARRRFPFAAPAGLLAPGRGDLVRRRSAARVRRQPRRRRVGKRVPAREPARTAEGRRRPGHRARWHRDRRPQHPRSHDGSDLVFIPLRFVVAWVAGYALRERAEQAEAAEMRAALAEREREAAARVAVAEERARIARELHDIVAHAMSVMVLQVGAVRHKLPQALEEDREALGRVERAGRTALAEMRRLLGAMRRDGDGLDLAPQPGLDGLDSLVEDVGRAGLPAAAARRRRPLPASARDRPLRLSNRPGGPDQLAEARQCQPRRRDRPLSATTSSASKSSTTARAPRRATASATASSASASASRSTAAR